MKHFALGVVVGLVLATSMRAEAGYYNFSSVAQALVQINGHVSSATRAQWQMVYWQKQAALRCKE